MAKWLQQKGILVVTTSKKEERTKEYLDTVINLTTEEIHLSRTPLRMKSSHFLAFTRCHQNL